METTGLALVGHWDWAAGKGLMNKNTASAFRAACTQILKVQDNWEELDVTRLDVDSLLKRFQNKRGKDFKPESLNAYKRRFRQALTSFLKYMHDPSRWNPTGRGGTRKTLHATSQILEHEPSSYSLGMGKKDSSDNSPMLQYPFPLREGRTALLILPADLTSSEVRRLWAFMSTLVTDFKPSE